jgi:hypothetical protein
MFGFSTVKLIALAVAAAAILSFVLLALHWKSTMTDRGQQLATICAATRLAADNPKMDCKAVPQQIGLMGTDIANLKAGLDKQNAAVTALGTESDRQKAEAAVAVSKAATRAQGVEGTIERLKASSRASGPPAGSQAVCVPSKEVQRDWQ